MFLNIKIGTFSFSHAQRQQTGTNPQWFDAAHFAPDATYLFLMQVQSCHHSAQFFSGLVAEDVAHFHEADEMSVSKDGDEDVACGH